jgi:hypothetical protein
VLRVTALKRRSYLTLMEGNHKMHGMVERGNGRNEETFTNKRDGVLLSHLAVERFSASSNHHARSARRGSQARPNAGSCTESLALSLEVDAHACCIEARVR